MKNIESKYFSRYSIILFAVSVLIFSCTTINNNGNNPDCSGTSIVVNTTFSNSSSSASTGTITVTSPLNSDYTYKLNSGAYQVGSSFSGLAPGTYIITAKNNAGCTGATSVTISGFDCSSTNINVIATATGATSDNGSIAITNPIGSNYLYSINGTTFQSSPIFNNLSPNNYTVIAKDQNGCTGSIILQVLGCNSSNFNGRDTGSHTLFINELNASSLGFGQISSDTLDVSKSGNTANLTSKFFNRTITGVFSSSNCNLITLDSIIFSASDTIKILIPTLPLPGSIWKLYNLRMGGTATVTTTGFTTRINIANGKTNMSAPLDLSNLAGLKMNFRGTFIKL